MDKWTPVWGMRRWHQYQEGDAPATVRHFARGKLVPGSRAGWYVWKQGAGDDDYHGPFKTMAEAKTVALGSDG